jgi:Rrf2 family nitric oxide-sensitive transcriptional repressor
VQLSLHADYALRVLIYIGANPGRMVRTQEISDAYGISKHHLVRVMHTLEEHGYIQIHAGRSGGVTLACEPQAIRLGEVVRHTEPNLRLAECFDMQSNTCPIAGVCGLKRILNEALSKFIAALNAYTLADIVGAQDRRKLANAFASFVGWTG